MNWIDLNNLQQLADLRERSKYRSQVIFKHSTRCSISSLAKNRLEKNGQPQNCDFYYLDLIRHRDLSNQVAEMFGVAHESPQVILIENAECIYEESHNGITMDELLEQVTLK